MKLTPLQWSAFNFFGFYCAFGVLLPFLPMWLNHYGYSTSQIGFIIALGYLFRFCGGMIFSRQVKQADELLPLTRKLAWGSALSLLLVAWAVESLSLLIPAIALFHILSGGSMPINETIASTWQKQVKMDYGKARLFGSIAFVIGSISTGYLVQWWGAQSIIWIMATFIILLSVGQMFPPTIGFQNHQSKGSSATSYWSILKQKNIFRMLIAVSLIQAGHAAYYAYSTIYWQSIGISTQISSLLWGLAVIAEIALFFWGSRFFGTQSIATLLIISALGAMLRWLMVASVTDPILLAISQLLHALSFGLSHYAMVRYISAQSSEIMPKLQGLYFALSNCAFMALFVLLAGVMYSYLPESAFYLMVILVLPSLFIVPKGKNVKLN